MAITPEMTLQKSVARATQAFASTGMIGALDRAGLARALGYTNPQSGRLSVLLTSLQLYGLLERNRTSYTFTQLFVDIFTQQHSLTGTEALRVAALAPVPFRRLFDAFDGQRLPNDVSHWLIREFRDSLSVQDAKKASQIFLDNVQFTGLIRDGFLGDHSNAEVQEPESRQPHTSSEVTTLKGSYLEKDFGGGRVASVRIPADLTQEERDVLMALIQYL
jgi:hypothetical protein